MNYYGYPYIALTGGADGALDSLDGSLLKDGDFAVVVMPTVNLNYIYTLDEDSAAAESSPDVISPDSNAGDKRWVLTSIRSANVNFTPSGAGASERTTQAKLREMEVSPQDYGATADGVANDRTAIAAADTATAARIVFPLGTYLVSTSLTITSPVTMRPGAIISIPTGQTLTINGKFTAGIGQCFSLAGTGTVVFGTNAVDGVRPEWFGAVGDASTDDSTALQASVTCCLSNIAYPLPMLCAGRYRIATMANIDRQVDHDPVHYIYTGIFRIIGEGRSAGFYATTAVTMFGSTLTDNVTPNSEGIAFENIQFELDDSATAAYVLDGEAFLRVNFDHCRFWKIKCLTSSIYVQNIHFKRCEMAGWSGTFFAHPDDSGFDITWEHNKIESGDALWTCNIANGCRFINNLCEYITGRPIKLQVSNGVTISFNYFEGCDMSTAGTTDDPYIETGVPFGVTLLGNLFLLTVAQIADADFHAVYWWASAATGDYSARALSAGNYCSGKLHNKADLLTYGDDNGWVSLGDQCEDATYVSRMPFDLKIMNLLAANLSEYANNAAALAAGKVVNDLYHTSGTVKIVTA